MPNRTVFVMSLCVAALIAPCAAAAQSQDASVAAIRAADRSWSSAFARKDLRAALAAVTPDATLMAPNHPAAFGRAGITRALSQLFRQRGFSVSWSPIDAGVAASGDLGYSRGTYRADGVASGKPVHDRGKYVTVWKKQDGAWKVYLDMFNSDLTAR